jgi:hypothetical protein
MRCENGALMTMMGDTDFDSPLSHSLSYGRSITSSRGSSLESEV